MPGSAKVLILDDDIWSLRLLKGILLERFPELEVETRTDPDVHGTFGIYFLDNDFNGQRLAAGLARQIRKLQPKSLIIAFSATLDAETFRDLVAAGCDGACDKLVASDVPAVLEITDKYLRALKLCEAGSELAWPIPEVKDLLQHWNSRLERKYSGR